MLATDYARTYIMYLYEDCMCKWVTTLRNTIWVGNNIEVHVGYDIAGETGKYIINIYVVLLGRTYEFQM